MKIVGESEIARIAHRRSRRRRRARRLVRLLGRVRSRLHARRPVAPRAGRRAAGSRGADAPARARVPLLRREPLGSRRSARATRRRCSPAPPASRAGRLPAVLGITGDDAEAIAKLLQLHPVFQPRTYVVARDRGARRAHRSLRACTTRRASTNRTIFSWIASMHDEPSPALDDDRARDQPARVEHARCRRAPASGSRGSIVIDPDAEPARPSPTSSSRASPPARPSRSCRAATCGTDRGDRGRRRGSRRQVDDRTWHLWEQHAHPFLRCNVWLVRGRDRSMLVDTGLGIVSLSAAARDLFDQPLAAVATHYHFDHVGSLHEFPDRYAHPEAAPFLASSSEIGGGLRTRRLRARASGSTSTTRATCLDDELLTALPVARLRRRRVRGRAVPREPRAREGDVIDLGDIAYEVLHLPGHSPDSIGLFAPRRAARCSPATRSTTVRCSKASTTAVRQRTSRPWNACATFRSRSCTAATKRASAATASSRSATASSRDSPASPRPGPSS